MLNAFLHCDYCGETLKTIDYNQIGNFAYYHYYYMCNSYSKQYIGDTIAEQTKPVIQEPESKLIISNNSRKFKHV